MIGPLGVLAKVRRLFDYERDSVSFISALHRGLDSLSQHPRYDVSFSNNVLQIKDIPQSRTFVINRQPFRKEIWLSSPISGPYHFSYSPTLSKWVDRRSNEMLSLLEREIPEMRQKSSLQRQANSA